MRFRCEDEHAKILDVALRLPLPDAAFTIIHYNSHRRCIGPRPHCEPIDLRVLHRSHRPSDVELWTAKVNKLLGEAYAVGDSLLRKADAYEKMRAAFERANPGFLDDTYSEAVSYGCFQAR